MTAATFGDLIGLARAHLEAASLQPDNALRAETIAAAAQATSRVALTLSGYLGDIAPYEMAEAITSRELDAQAKAAVNGREALQLAAAALRPGADDEGEQPTTPLADRLTAAGIALAAGRDLLRTHFAMTLIGDGRRARHGPQ
jgi:hypothetical protein